MRVIGLEQRQHGQPPGEVAAAMIRRLHLHPHARDEQGPLDAAAPAEFVARLSRLGAGAPWPAFTFEVNPIKWRRDGVVAVDGLLVIEQP